MSTGKALLAAGLIASLTFLGGAQSWAKPRGTISSYACKCTCDGVMGTQTKLFTIKGTSSAVCTGYNDVGCQLTTEGGGYIGEGVLNSCSGSKASATGTGPGGVLPPPNTGGSSIGR
jgi:hypothetical protein